MDIQSSTSDDLFELYPVIIPGWITPVKPVDLAHGGIPKSLYDDQPRGLQCLIEPLTEMQRHAWTLEAWDRVDLYVNDDSTPVAGDTVQPGEEANRMPLYIPHGRLNHGVNRLHYIVTRPSDNSSQPSTDLFVLYHLRAPGEPAPEGLDLLIPPDVVRDGVSAESAAQGVEFGFAYTNPRNYDRINFLVGNVSIPFEVNDASMPVVKTLFTDTFQQAGDNPNTLVEYRVTDQLGNSNQSPTKRLDIHLDQTLNPLAPSVKEASGVTLNPVNAKDTLTIVVPANAALRPDDKLKVKWIGAPGTPAGGSYVSGETLVSAGLDIEIPNSVVAFNLGKSVKVSYEVIRGNETPIPSPEFPLAVQTFAPGDLLLAKPKILEAANNGEGPELDVSTISAHATCWLGTWPLIASEQDVWLRLKGTKADGTTGYDLNIWTPPPRGPMVSPTWISQGKYETPAPYAYLKELKDGSELTMEFKADFSQTTSETNAQLFPLRIYIIKAVEWIAPTLIDILDSKGSVVNGSTVESSVRVTGTGTSGRQIQLMDGTANIGTAVTIPETGTTWTTTLTSLTAKAYSIKAKALYGTGLPNSEAKAFNVVAAATPIIISVKEPEEASIPNGGTTAATSVTLTGSATAGFSVNILDKGVFKGSFVATGGTWTTTTISVAPGSHSFIAKAQYGSEPDSVAWTFTVITLTEAHKPYIQQAENNGEGAMLDLATFTGNATVKVRPWPGIAAGQRVWLRCRGKKANGDDHLITLYSASPVTATEVTTGLSKSLERSQLELLGNNTALTVELKVKFNGSSTEDGATVFPLRTYNLLVTAPANIEVGFSPTRHALSPDGAYLYVCIFQARKIVVVSTATYTVIRTIDSPEPTRGPADISISADGRYAYVFLSTYLLGVGPNSIRVLDLTTHSFTSTSITPYDTTNAIALTKNGAHIYTMTYGYIFVYDLITLSIVGTIPINGLADNNFITFDPSGDRGYSSTALGHGPSTIEVIDTSTHSLLRSINIPNDDAASVTLSPDGTRAYIGHNPGTSDTCSVSVLDMTTERTIATIHVPYMNADRSSTLKVICSVDGTRVYLYGSRYRQIAAINTVTLTSMPSIPIPDELTGNGVYHITCSSTGAYLYASMAAGDQVYIVPTNS